MTRGIYDAFMTGPEWMVELTHAYTYSAQPLAVAAGLATLDVYAEEGLFQRAADLAPYFEDAIHALKGLPNVVDVRNLGMMAAVEVAPREGTHPTARSYRSEEHTSELQSLMRISYAVFCLKKKIKTHSQANTNNKN